MFKILFPFIALGIFAFSKTANKLSKLKTQVTKLQYKSININAIRFYVDLLVTNPGKKVVSINEISLAINYKGSEVSQITKRGLTLPVNPEKSAKISNIYVDIDLLSAINNILKALLSDYDKNVIVTGYIVSDGLKYPVNEKIDLIKI